METSLQILTLGFLIVFLSCGQPKGKNNITDVVIDTLPTKIDKKEKEQLGEQRQIEEQDRIDSLRLDTILNGALKTANQNIGRDKFHIEYKVSPDSNYTVNTEIGLDKYFSTFYSHLVIRRYAPNTVYIDIYIKNDSRFKKVLSHEQWTMEYMNDTICDINGDGLKDFVVNWYGSNGCCLKAFSDVYLQRADNKSFSNSLEFINPTFSPIEQIIRGICYGHPGETEMYKYKWNKEAVDTIEYVYYETNDNGAKTGNVIVSNNLPSHANHKVLKRLSSVPAEYRKIEGYDWFADNLEKNGNR